MRHIIFSCVALLLAIPIFATVQPVLVHSVKQRLQTFLHLTPVDYDIDLDIREVEQNDRLLLARLSYRDGHDIYYTWQNEADAFALIDNSKSALKQIDLCYIDLNSDEQAVLELTGSDKYHLVIKR